MYTGSATHVAPPVAAATTLAFTGANVALVVGIGLGLLVLGLGLLRLAKRAGRTDT